MIPEGFYDIHTHVLPYLDEGASGMDQTLKMLEIAKKDGIVGIVATPHIMDGIYDNSIESIKSSIESVKDRSNGLSLYIGAELRVSNKIIEKIKARKVPLINQKTYLLLEFPAYSLPPLSVMENIFKELRSLGITPIIGHPERNISFLRNINLMKEFLKAGCVFQITAMSITNEFTSKIQKAVMNMIKKRYVHVVASDAHDTKRRPPILSQAYELIRKSFNEDMANILFIENPYNIINGLPITELSP